jgi:hypothetical protein
MHIHKHKKPAIQLVGGIENKIILKEVGVAAEEAYPAAESRPYINMGKIYDVIRANPLKYVTLNTAVSDRYLKTILTIVFRRIYCWEPYTSKTRKHKGNNIFIRPEVK